MNGFFNRILKINVTKKTYRIETIEDGLLEKYLGGKGLATHLLLQQNPAGLDPLAPENHLILAIGPVTGTSTWGSCRQGIFTKSPQTDFYSESYSGGTVAEHMVRTGYDAFIIHGATDRPVWIHVTDSDVRFKDAQDLWGLDTYHTENRVRSLLAEDHPHRSSRRE
jgi:aldehyde:ferredoxin oxidoreductase